MRRFSMLVIAAAALLVFAGTRSFALGYLKIHPSNPHYFQEDGTGRPVLIASVSAIVPAYLGYDYVAGLNETILRRRLSYSRVWWWGSYEEPYSVLPWGFSQTTGACYALPYKFDLNTWNSTYFTRLGDAMAKANTGGVYAQIMIFERCCMSPADPGRWGGNAYAYENNINGLETPTCTSDGTPEFYGWSTRPNLKNQQERWVKKLIDETITYPNMIYEIENEHWQADSAGWADHYGDFIKDYIADNYPSSPRLVSYSSIVSDEDLDQCFNWSCIDIVNRHYGNDLEDDPSIVNPYIEDRWGYSKAINVDEFANGLTDPDVLREICWTIITSGGNFHIEDAADEARPPDICENIRSFLALSGWDFISASPQASLVANGAGYCMKNPGVEYVCYFPQSGSKTVNIASGSYRQEWWDPATGGFYNISNFTHAGGNKTFVPPDSSDWVLHITTQAAPTTVLNSKYASNPITIDAATSDWNLGEFAIKMRGGSTGAGDTGIVEFDTDGVCYTGGHSDTWQLLPMSAQDHAVKIYSRNDASYLYFLLRVTDDDIQYPNDVDSNYANDCVEFYIDPGHDHGSASMSSSTSDLQLVIDANNQRNVYTTTSGYKTQVLAGVTSAVSRDSTGWWLEVRIQKTALDPDIPSGSGTIGIDFCFRDNDNNNDTALTTMTSWRDPEVSSGFPTKIPNRWGDLNVVSEPDTTPPGNVTNFTATAGTLQVALSWTNPTDADFTGTMIRAKTTGYPTSVTDGMLVIDKPGSAGAADNYTHSDLTGGVTYYYTAFAHDAVPNYASGVTASATPYAPSLSTINAKSAANLNLVIDATSTDWSMGDFATKSRGGQEEFGDIAIVGFDGATCYYGGYCTSMVLPTDASDHTAKVYSRHDQQYMYFLVRCDDDQMNYANGVDTNWANDCIEFYIDPSHNHGSVGLALPGTSTSDLQLVIDCNNQKNVYCTTSDYKTQVLAGVSSAIVRDDTGWWLEVRITKSALDPNLPASGSFGVDFCFRDNDNPTPSEYAGDPAYSTVYSWRDNPSGASFPTKVPDVWGDTLLSTLDADTTAPASVTSLAAMPGSQQIALNWTNPATSDWTGTMIRFKTTGYPTGPTDGTQCYNGTGSSADHTGLTNGVTYYYCAYAYDEVPNYATPAQASATPEGATVCTINTKSAANANLVVDASSSDWSLGDFTTKSRGGQDEAGDYAIIGYDGATCYYGGYWTGGVLPTSATDHTAKVYSRHDQQFMFFLVRCDDDQINYANAADTNWANDCVEFYIDPGHDHGSVGLTHPGTSTSDLQLVIDANNQKNVYCCTDTYKNQVLAGVTSAVVRDGTGWWLEAQILKSALDPDLPNSGSFGVDFCFRDNDNPDETYWSGNPAYSTMYSWHDNPSGGAFPTKVPDVWGDASLDTLAPDTTPPASVTSFAATPGNQQVSLGWANPATADWAGTMIRFKTTGYPTGPTDGTLCYDGTGSSQLHTGLTGGVTYYYCAYAYDEVPNYATAAQASATPASGVPWQVQYEGNVLPCSDGWTLDTGSEDWAHIDSGTLHVNDDSSGSGSQVTWSKSWSASNSTGTTVEARMRCDSVLVKNASKNVELYDGTKCALFLLQPDRIQARTSGGETCYLSGNEWHTYRFTLQGSTWKVYLDGESTPIMTGAPDSDTTNALKFGVRSFSGKQSIYFDYVYYTAGGVYTP